MSEIKIETIQIKICGNTISLTVEQVFQLKRELERLIGCYTYNYNPNIITTTGTKWPTDTTITCSGIYNDTTK